MSDVTELTSVGDVLVHLGEPPAGNPYRGHGRIPGTLDRCTLVTGSMRREALRNFRDGFSTTRYTFWHAPSWGGARRIESRDEVNWPPFGH